MSNNRKYILMKPIQVLLIMVFCIAGIGIATAGPAPDLTGKWVEKEISLLDYAGVFSNATSEENYWTITQQGNLISGMNYFSNGERLVEEPIAGVISPDGTEVTMVDSSGGLYTAYITGDDEMTVNYVNTGDVRAEENYAFAFSEVLQRA